MSVPGESPAATAPPAGPEQAETPEQSGSLRTKAFRPDIQALRALAVIAVVVYHVWPDGLLPGGFIGVDVFFVISGYLITGHLLRDVDQPVRTYLAQFWTRRAIRILPASFVMLLSVGLAGGLLLPKILGPAHWGDLLAATLYVENLHLIQSATQYLHADAPPTAFQHAWSLSVEEQFYLVWPLLMLGLVLVGRRLRSPRGTRLAVLLGLAVLAVASLAWSVLETAEHPARAYFSTLTRAHEFAIGALLAALPGWRPHRSWAARMGRWGGFALVLCSAVLIDSDDAFPGFLALVPCLGAAALIWAGDVRAVRDPLWGLFRSGPAQWVGDASYSIYLWHWPLVVLVPFAGLGWLGWLGRYPAITIVLLTLALAALSRRFVELPSQRWLRRKRPRDVGLLTLVGMVLLVTAGLGGRAETSTTGSRGSQPSAGKCVGAAATMPDSGCEEVFTGPATVELGPADMYATLWNRECAPTYPHCTPGGKPKTAASTPRTVALVGDSHAKSLYPALAKAAAARGWSVSTVIRMGCPPNTARFSARAGAPTSPEQCRAFAERATQELARIKPALIVVTATTDEIDYISEVEAVEGFSDLWGSWQRIAPVAVVREYPLPRADEAHRCIGPRTAKLQAQCAVPRRVAVPDDLPMTVAAKGMARSSRFQFVDLTDAYCDPQHCHPVVGGVPVYYDRAHINGAFSATLAKPLGAAIRWPV